jgi:uncharacterized protein (TIRG00374 family)
MIINGIINIELFRGLGIRLPFWEGVVLAASATFANQLPISGGLITRAYYLKQKFGLSYSKFLSVNVALFVCFASANGLMGVSIILYWMLISNMAISVYLLIGFGLMAGSIFLFLLPINKLKFPRRIQEQIEHAIDGWNFIRKNKTLLTRLVIWQTLMMFILAIRYYLVFNMMSQEVRGGEVILFSAASVLTQLISIAPGGLGILEAVVGGVASMLNFDLGVSIVALGIDRLVSTIVVFLVGGSSSIVLSKQLANLPSVGTRKDEISADS